MDLTLTWRFLVGLEDEDPWLLPVAEDLKGTGFLDRCARSESFRRAEFLRLFGVEERTKNRGVLGLLESGALSVSDAFAGSECSGLSEPADRVRFLELTARGACFAAVLDELQRREGEALALLRRMSRDPERQRAWLGRSGLALAPELDVGTIKYGGVVARCARCRGGPWRKLDAGGLEVAFGLPEVPHPESASSRAVRAEKLIRAVQWLEPLLLAGFTSCDPSAPGTGRLYPRVSSVSSPPLPPGGQGGQGGSGRGQGTPLTPLTPPESH